MGNVSTDKLAEMVDSRYSLVVLAARRAKQIREGAPKLIATNSTNPLTIALEEIASGVVGYQVPDNDNPPVPKGAEPELLAIPEAPLLEVGETEESGLTEARAEPDELAQADVSPALAQEVTEARAGAGEAEEMEPAAAVDAKLEADSEAGPVQERQEPAAEIAVAEEKPKRGRRKLKVEVSTEDVAEAEVKAAVPEDGPAEEAKPKRSRKKSETTAEADAASQAEASVEAAPAKKPRRRKAEPAEV